MQRLARIRSRRVAILVLAVAMTATVLFLAAPRQAAAITGCPVGESSSRNTIYCNTNHQKVGECFGCEGTCSGEQTDDSISVLVCCPAGN